MNDLIIYNKDGLDTFQYGIELVKPSGTRLGIGQFVSEFNVWESLFAKSMQFKMGLVDGAGIIAKFGVTVGDTVSVTLSLHDNDEKKILMDFVILEVGDGDRTDNSQGRTFVMSGLHMSAHLNQTANVMESYNGTISSIVQDICQRHLNLKLTDVEETMGTRKIISPGNAPFDVLGWCCKNAQNSVGDHDSLYFFWHTADGHKFKTLRKTINDAKVHSYTVTVDKNSSGSDSDVFRILGFQQLKLGNQSQRTTGGLYENELVQFNHLNRNITASKQTYVDQQKAVHVLRQQPVADLEQVANTWTSDASSKIRGLSANMKVRSDDATIEQQNTYQDKFHASLMQSQLFNQIGFALEIHGNPAIRAGDVIDIDAPELSSVANKGKDYVLHGKFLVADVRHRVWQAEHYRTFLTVYTDGYDTNVMAGNK